MKEATNKSFSDERCKEKQNQSNLSNNLSNNFNWGNSSIPLDGVDTNAWTNNRNTQSKGFS